MNHNKPPGYENLARMFLKGKNAQEGGETVLKVLAGSIGTNSDGANRTLARQWAKSEEQKQRFLPRLTQLSERITAGNKEQYKVKPNILSEMIAILSGR